MKIKRSVAVAALLTFLLGAAAIGNVPRGSGSSCSVGVVSRMYLGQSTPYGTVAEAQWLAFVAESVSSRFSDGFTVLAAHGHWRDVHGRLLQEQTRIIEIAHDDSLLVRSHVRAIATDCARRFAQQSVLVTQSRSAFCFEPGIGVE